MSSLGPVLGGFEWARAAVSGTPPRSGRQGAPQDRPPQRGRLRFAGPRVTSGRPPVRTQPGKRSRHPPPRPSPLAAGAGGGLSWSPSLGPDSDGGLRPGERGGGVCGRPHPDSPGAAHAPGPPDSAAAPGDPLPAQGRPPSAPAPCPSSRTAKRGPLCTAARDFPEGGGSILANAPALSARRRGLPRPRGWVLGPLSRGISWSEEELSK